MDNVIKNYPSVPFDELSYCYQHSIMYQTDMSKPVAYDNKYFENYVRLENTDISRKLNKGRTSITEKHCEKILDIGVGSGEFIKQSNIRVYGYDINPVAIKWLREEGLYVDPYAKFPDVDGVTFWDAIEHIPNPNLLLEKFPSGCLAFISIPIFTDLTWIKKSKHYKPNEHFYYFTTQGMIKFMTDSGFVLVELSDYETRAGREDIFTFVFRKN
jgi:hypothetical protein